MGDENSNQYNTNNIAQSQDIINSLKLTLQSDEVQQRSFNKNEFYTDQIEKIACSIQETVQNFQRENQENDAQFFENFSIYFKKKLDNLMNKSEELNQQIEKREQKQEQLKDLFVVMEEIYKTLEKFDEANAQSITSSINKSSPGSEEIQQNSQYD